MSIEITRCERSRQGAVFVKETIAIFQSRKLVGDNARCDGTDDTTLDGPFTHQPKEEIDVIDAGVRAFQLLHYLKEQKQR